MSVYARKLSEYSIDIGVGKCGEEMVSSLEEKEVNELILIGSTIPSFRDLFRRSIGTCIDVELSEGTPYFGR